MLNRKAMRSEDRLATTGWGGGEQFKRALASGGRAAAAPCYHFATQLGGTRQNEVV
jgi:hypothetical protein